MTIAQRLVEQAEGEVLLAVVDYPGRDARALAAGGVVRPAFGQKQPSAKRLARARRLFGAVQAHRPLAVGRLAQGPAVILPGF